MSSARRSFRQEMVRTFFGPLVLYALIIQALVLPFARARAAIPAMGDTGIAILCTTDGMSVDPAQGDGARHGLHGLDCCLPGRWSAFDQPFIATSDAPAFLAVRRAHRFDHLPRPPVRGPPAVAQTPLQPRAPPIPA